MKKEFKVDMTKLTDEEMLKLQKQSDILFKLNHTSPSSEEFKTLLEELVDGHIGNNFTLRPPLYGAAFDMLDIGDNVFINSNCLAMARGGIIIEDDVMLAANVQLLSNNHDEYKRHILDCKQIHIKKGAWIGAGASILPGVTIGKYAIVGAGAIVTKDVPDYSVVIGSPARVIKTLDKNKFQE